MKEIILMFCGKLVFEMEISRHIIRRHIVTKIKGLTFLSGVQYSDGISCVFREIGYIYVTMQYGQ